MCLCLFLFFGIKRRKKIYKICCKASFSRLSSVLTLLSCCLLLLNLILHSSRIYNQQKMSMRIPTFSTCAFLCLSSGHRPLPAFVSLCLHSSLGLELACFFTHHITSPVISTRLFFAHVFVYMHLSSPLIIMFCVLFSVSKLFVPFSVSFLSLLGPCVEGGQCRLSTQCGQFQVLH